MASKGKYDNWLKLVGIIVLVYIVISLLNNVAYLNLLISSLLTVAIKILWLVFVITLVIGLVVAVNKYLIGKKKIDRSLTQEFAGASYTCKSCEAALKNDYKFCPTCGAEKTRNAKTTGKTQIPKVQKSQKQE